MVAAQPTTSSSRAGVLAVQMLLAGDALMFAALLAAYGVLAAGNAAGHPPSLAYGALMTALLAGTSAVLALGKRVVGERRRLALALALALAFVALAVVEYRTLIASGAHVASLADTFFFLLTGFHLAHVIPGVLVLAWALWRPLPGRPVEIYWHYVDVVWVVLFVLLYL